VDGTKKHAAQTGLQPMLDAWRPRSASSGSVVRRCQASVGITYRSSTYWARTDLVRPSINDAKGSGTQRTYSFSDSCGSRS